MDAMICRTEMQTENQFERFQISSNKLCSNGARIKFNEINRMSFTPFREIMYEFPIQVLPF